MVIQLQNMQRKALELISSPEWKRGVVVKRRKPKNRSKKSEAIVLNPNFS